MFGTVGLSPELNLFLKKEPTRTVVGSFFCLSTDQKHDVHRERRRSDEE